MAFQKCHPAVIFLRYPELVLFSGLYYKKGDDVIVNSGSLVSQMLRILCDNVNISIEPVTVFENHLRDHGEPADLFDILHMIKVSEYSVKLYDIISQENGPFWGLDELGISQQSNVRLSIALSGLFHDWSLVLPRDYIKKKLKISGPINRFVPEHHERSAAIASEALQAVLGTGLTDEVYRLTLDMILLNGQELATNSKFMQIHAIVDEVLNQAQMAPWRMLGYFHLEMSDHLANFNEELLDDETLAAALKRSLTFIRKHLANIGVFYNSIGDVSQAALKELGAHLGRDKKVYYMDQFRENCPQAYGYLLEQAFCCDMSSYYLSNALVSFSLGASWQLVKNSLLSKRYGYSPKETLKEYQEEILNCIHRFHI